MPRTPITEYGYHFINDEQIPEGNDEYWLRDQQIEHWNALWRHLTTQEIERLEDQGNVCADWNHLLVEDPFDISLIRNNAFYGLVRIGSMEPYLTSYHDFCLPEGVRDSHIVSCDIGRHASIHRCGFISHYIIGEQSILSGIDELDCTNHAKFGIGVVMDGESEDVRIWLGLMNEAEGRKVLPFESMICADAWIWATYRENKGLMNRLVELTNQTKDKRRGWYAVIGNCSVIKSCRIIKDVYFGPYSYVKGANKLKNLTIKSSEASPSQIGEGVELVNGIIGYGCHVFYGVKAVRFIMGNNSNLKYGARLLNSILGDNSTISCCEVLNSLVFPFHEQHHNNSFLIAALVQGQSNMAAGANIGSNHNTRGNDGELIARRGFWPALSSSIKYNSSFAPFTIIVKGDYPNELNIPLPFSLISYNEHDHCLTVMPAYWWMYNRYALERNDWKFHNRDRRTVKVQHIETEYLAPDTMESIEHAMDLLGLWTAKAAQAVKLPQVPANNDETVLIRYGRNLLEQHRESFTLEVTATGLERSSTPTRIIKAVEAYHAYKEMLLFASVRLVLSFAAGQEECKSVSDVCRSLKVWAVQESCACDALCGPFVNAGGQVVSEKQVLRLIDGIVSGQIDSWQAVHDTYDRWAMQYPKIKTYYALEVLERLYGRTLDEQTWKQALAAFVTLCNQNANEVLKTRKKDFEESFRHCTYRNQDEMDAVLGKPEDVSFVKESRKRMDYLIAQASQYGTWQ
ncbi:MAG: DUF4954 family protein [Sphaerochaetaceae bacterium]|nr:DUF4954 family protein [Sphaerochaetaceae bacterium]